MMQLNGFQLAALIQLNPCERRILVLLLGKQLNFTEIWARGSKTQTLHELRTRGLLRFCDRHQRAHRQGTKVELTGLGVDVAEYLAGQNTRVYQILQQHGGKQ